MTVAARDSMKIKLLSAGVLLSIVALQMPAAEPEWSSSRVKDCDRECLVGFMDGYMNAVYKHDPKAVPPLSINLRMIENTGHMDVGEGVLWRNKVEPTSFKIYVADPVTGQVALQARLLIGGAARWWPCASRWIAGRFPRSSSSTIGPSTMRPFRC
jgi:hypothetical protein